MTTYFTSAVLAGRGARYTARHTCLPSGATAVHLEIDAHDFSVHVQPGDELAAAAAFAELSQVLTDRARQEGTE